VGKITHSYKPHIISTLKEVQVEINEITHRTKNWCGT